MRMQTNVCVHGHMCAYIRTCVCVQVHHHMCEQICLHACICIDTHAYVCTCMQIHPHTCEQTCLYMQIHPCTLIYTGAHTALYVNAHTEADTASQGPAKLHERGQMCTYVCANPHMHTDAHIWPHTCTYTHVRTGVCVQIHRHTCEHNRARTQAWADACTRANLHVHFNAATSVHAHTPCTRAPSPACLHPHPRTHPSPSGSPASGWGRRGPGPPLSWRAETPVYINSPAGTPAPGAAGGLPGDLQTGEGVGCTKQSGC